ncbi:MAG: hypothetical protein COT84_08105 [Chlamydiae bacterium CG10_big_fil_rev_8_21_14_0_10_35_9]|nr:MAG: hypothetical protein COT84_08105 [Chlamydiae bacterium CG10_big_fil_rev_8_21_14_0_10_35_9]
MNNVCLSNPFMLRHQFLSYLYLVKWILISQFIFIGLHIAFSFLLKPILTFSGKRKEKKLAAFKSYLIKAIQQKKEFSIPLFAGCKCNIPFLVPLILKVNEEVKDSHWETLKKSISQNLLFPQAKKLTYSKKWTKRVQAAGCYLHFPDTNNEPEVLYLLQDPVPIIKYSAAACAAKLGTYKSANAVIDAMSCNRFLRHPFQEALLGGNPKSFDHIEKRFEKETDPYKRVSCLEVLAHKMNSHIVDLAEKDLYAAHLNLRIAAIRALGHFFEPRSISLLLPLLKAPEWEVKAIAARSLGYLKAEEAVSELLNLLKDKTWWVRMNSALALKRIGDKGIKTLNQVNPKEDRYAYEAAQFALKVDLYE